MATQDVEEMIAHDRRERIVKGVIGLVAVVAFTVFMAYVIASGFATV